MRCPVVQCPIHSHSPESGKAVYEAPYPIPELCVAAGDLIVVQPGHETAPLVAIHPLTADDLPALLKHLQSVKPVVYRGRRPQPTHRVREWLLQRYRRDRRFRVIH